MSLKSVQVRLSEEQLAMIDEKIKAGEYPSRSEAIRDYVRRAETFDLFNRLLDLLETKPVTDEQLEQVRQKVWDKKYSRLLHTKAK
jgi:Arc/MetJ-type ribon-helix-helix transcriptional regulator